MFCACSQCLDNTATLKLFSLEKRISFPWIRSRAKFTSSRAKFGTRASGCPSLFYTDAAWSWTERVILHDFTIHLQSVATHVIWLFVIPTSPAHMTEVRRMRQRLKSRDERNALSRVVQRLTSGHSKLNAHLFKIGRLDSPNWKIYSYSDIVSHFLLKCLNIRWAEWNV